jgi:hypothetical protein
MADKRDKTAGHITPRVQEVHNTSHSAMLHLTIITANFVKLERICNNYTKVIPVNGRSARKETKRHVKKPHGSLPCSQGSVTGHYPEPDESSIQCRNLRNPTRLKFNVDPKCTVRTWTGTSV